MMRVHMIKRRSYIGWIFRIFYRYIIIMSTYHYSLSTDFPGGLDTGAFHYAISVAIPEGNLNGITVNDDDVAIDFGAVLDSGQETILNNLVANYVYEIPNIVQYDSAPVNRFITTSNSYQVMSTYNYKGVNTFTPGEIVCGSFMSGNLSSYSIRVYDRTNDRYVCESEFTNTDTVPVSIDTFGNLSYYGSFWEFQAKRNGGDQYGMVNINYININYLM